MLQLRVHLYPKYTQPAQSGLQVFDGLLSDPGHGRGLGILPAASKKTIEQHLEPLTTVHFTFFNREEDVGTCNAPQIERPNPQCLQRPGSSEALPPSCSEPCPNVS